MELKEMDYLEVYDLSTDELREKSTLELCEAIVQFNSELSELEGIENIISIPKYSQKIIYVSTLNTLTDRLYEIEHQEA